MQIPSSLATSRLGRPCSVTIRTAPALNASSYRGGAACFRSFVDIAFVPFPFHYTDYFSVRQIGYRGTTITVVSDKNDTLVGTDNVSGYSDTGVIYRFDERGNLYQGIYGFSYKTKEVWEYISMYSSLVEKLTEVYGEPSTNEILPFTMQSLIDIADPVTAVELGYVGYYAKWETATSIITLMLATENYKTQLALTYTDVNYQESSNNSGL